MCSANMLLHRTKALLLQFQLTVTITSLGMIQADQMCSRALTPRQRFRHLEPSGMVSGQTTSWVVSDVENEPVSEDLGGMARRI